MQTTLRKGLPQPELTDDGNITYTVGPAGRTVTTTGKLRDTARITSQLLDGFLEYNQNEQVTGLWEFTGPLLTDHGQAVRIINNTGAQRVDGDVVILDPNNDSQFILPNAASIDASKCFVVAETIPAAALGRCTVLGMTRVKAAPGTTRGMYLQTQNASVVATGSTVVTPGSFAYTLTGLDINNTVLAAVHAGGAGGGLEVREVDAAPDVIGTRILQFPNGSLTDLGSQVVGVSFGSSIVRSERYTVTGTTRVLGAVPDTLLQVSKNGLAQNIGVDVTLAGSTLTFTTALAGDLIEAVYIVTNSFNPSSAPSVQEFDATSGVSNPAIGGTTITLSNIPTTIMMVARNGVPQSQSKGDWSWTAGTAVITFSDVFIANDHIIVSYAQNFGGGNASSVNGLPAVPSTAIAPNSLVATDTNGFLPAAVISHIATLTVDNGLTVTTGGLRLVAGNLTLNQGSITVTGGAGVGTAAINTNGTFTGAAGSAAVGGINMQSTLAPFANNDTVYGSYFAPTLTAAGKTGLTANGVFLGTGAAPAGFLNNISLHVGQPTGATSNTAILVDGGGIQLVSTAGGGIGLGVTPSATIPLVVLNNAVGDQNNIRLIAGGNAGTDYAALSMANFSSTEVYRIRTDATGVNTEYRSAGGTHRFYGSSVLNLSVSSNGIGFFGVTPKVQATITGAKGGNAALASLITQLANFGLVVDSTTA